MFKANDDFVTSKRNGRYYFHHKSGAEVLTDKRLSDLWRLCDGKTIAQITQALGSKFLISDLYLRTALDVMVEARLLTESDRSGIDEDAPEPAGSSATGKVSVVIVNYNGRRHLPELLESLDSQTYADMEVIVVDNASVDDSVAYMKANHPQTKVLAQSKNLGFAGGNNCGIRAATGKYILLLNNDTVCDPGAVRRMVEVAEASDKPVVVAPLLKFYNLPGFINSVGNYVRPFGWGSDGYIGYVETGILRNVGQLASACFGAVLIPKVIMADVGLLDERYLFYYEDADWSYRARSKGYDIVFARRAVVYHKFNATMNTLPAGFKWSLVIRNRMRFALKNLSKGSALLFARTYLKEDIRRVLGSIKRREFSWLPVYGRAYAGLLVSIPNIIGQRRQVQRSKDKSLRDAQIFALWPELPPLLDPDGNPILDSGAIRRIYMHPATL